MDASARRSKDREVTLTEEMETRLPNRRNPKVGQRGSGHLAVSTSVWVAGLIKPAQSPDAGLETRLGANQDRKGRIRTSGLTSANLGRPRQIANVSNRP